MRYPALMGIGRFAQGQLTYSDSFGGDKVNARIVISVIVGDGIKLSAIVDTGAPWCIFGPEELESLNERFLEPLSKTGLWVRGTHYNGTLFRVPVTVADEGQGTDVTVEATVFIPTLRSGEEWLHPNFLGLDGFLHRLRFAVDPTENAFYFGAIED